MLYVRTSSRYALTTGTTHFSHGEKLFENGDHLTNAPSRTPNINNRHDEIGQATTLNLLLRNLLSQNLLDQAYKLASKTNFPESCSNNQFCRYL